MPFGKFKQILMVMTLKFFSIQFKRFRINRSVESFSFQPFLLSIIFRLIAHDFYRLYGNQWKKHDKQKVKLLAIYKSIYNKTIIMNRNKIYIKNKTQSNTIQI